MARLHHIYKVTHIYITSILLFISFFILLPSFWAGQLVKTLLVCHKTSGLKRKNDFKKYLSRSFFFLQEMLLGSRRRRTYELRKFQDSFED
jgi:hypothetical protein